MGSLAAEIMRKSERRTCGRVRPSAPAATAAAKRVQLRTAAAAQFDSWTPGTLFTRGAEIKLLFRAGSPSVRRCRRRRRRQCVPILFDGICVFPTVCGGPIQFLFNISESRRPAGKRQRCRTHSFSISPSTRELASTSKAVEPKPREKCHRY